MNIGVSGYFNKNSFGDNLILETWKQIFHAHSIKVVSYIDNVEDLDLDKIIIAGGGTLETHTYNKNIWNDSFFNYPTYVYGVGIADSCKTNKLVIDKYVSYFEKCKYIGLRSTFDLNIEYNLIKDVALAYDFKDYIKYKDKTIGITLRRNEYHPEILKLCKSLVDNGYSISVIQLYDGDITSNDYLYNVLRNEYGNKINFTNYVQGFENDIIKDINNLDYYITQKMHSYLIAQRYNTPSLLLGNMNKFKFICKSLEKEDNLVSNCDDLIETFETLKKSNNIKNNKINELITLSKYQIDKFKNLILF
jgi:polysaccharide pyruvyl transferase WcaK-like protein